MNLGILLILNFASVPFIFEAETLGVKLKTFPPLSNILKLKNVLKTRWIKLYGLFIIIMAIILMTPSRSGKSYSSGYVQLSIIILFQAVFWIFVICKIRNSNK